MQTQSAQRGVRGAIETAEFGDAQHALAHQPQKRLAADRDVQGRAGVFDR
ncbi:MAG: hypothetical protein P8011_15995 [Acidihalobacter sp.]